MTEIMWSSLYAIYRMFGKGSGCENPVQFLGCGDPWQLAPIDFGKDSTGAWGARGEETFFDCKFVLEMFDHVATLTTVHRSCEPEWVQRCYKLRDPKTTHTVELVDIVGWKDIPGLLETDEDKPKVICWSNATRKKINEAFGK